MEGRRRITLYDQMTASKTTSLADLILHDSFTAVSSAAAAAADSTAAAAAVDAESYDLNQSRTLVDILREDEHNNNNTTDRKSRKSFSFMDKLRFKLALNSRSNYSSETENNSANNSNNNNHIQTNLSELQARIDPDELTQQDATTTQRSQNDAVATTASADREIPAEGAVAEPVGVSLMDLLEETEMETGFEVSSNRMSDADFEDAIECEVEEEKCEEEGASIVERNCCVCMVRHRGAAFIPCGHTFCRLCSREVWVNRGNCPLCNNFILEILDIF